MIYSVRVRRPCGIPAGGLENSLAQEVDHAVIDVGRMPAILDGRDQGGHQSSLPIHPVQQESAKVAGDCTAVKVAANREAGHGRKTQLGWDRMTAPELIRPTSTLATCA